MKRLLMMLAVVLAVSQTPLWAQDVPAFEGFGGFSILTIGGGGSRFTPLGWQGAVSGNINETFSIVGDFGGQYKDGDKLHEYLGGPRANFRRDRANVFVHALFGGSRSSSTGGSANGFTMGYGGGVDINTSNDRIGIRVIQFDWLPSRFSGVWENNIVRFGFGITFKSAPR
jgi:hypothetical protein